MSKLTKTIHNIDGHTILYIIICLMSFSVAFVTLRYDVVMGIILALVPSLLYVLVYAMANPYWAYLGVFVVNYFVVGLMRYIPGLPAGVVLDAMIAYSFLILFVRSVCYRTVNFGRAVNGLTLVATIWFLYCVLELLNPNAVSAAWVSSARGVGIYFLMIVILTSVILFRFRDMKRILGVLSVLTLIAVLKAAGQKFLGFDAAENNWLYNEGGATTHIINYGVRYFSFFSDAGNFGAAMGFAMVIFSLSALQFKGKEGRKIRYYYLFVALVAAYGMVISGTRGAMAVPLVGYAIYTLISRKMKTFVVGVVLLTGVYLFFTETYIGQGVTEIRRMRSAFNKEDASYVTRLNNQRELRKLMVNKPFGAGIGMGGGKAKEYAPEAAISQIPTDSWFVMIWVETGIVGLILHIGILLYILGYGAYLVMFKLKNPQLRGIVAALTSGVGGIMVASYGNEVLGQMPTGMIIYVCQTFIFLSPRYDEALYAENEVEIND